VSTRVDPDLLHELKEYGAINPEACINCGNCTAICPLTTSEYPFPRRTIRYIQMGLKQPLLESLDPWMCYFCGDCSITCPKGAEPAETMMAARRWLIAQYDHSGKAKELYTSEKKVAWTIIRTALLPLLLLLGYHLLTGGNNIVTDRVVLNDFAPVMWVWALVLLHFVYLGFHLVRNSLNMTRYVLGEEASLLKIPLRLYFAALRGFAINFVTQREWWSKCDETRKVEFGRWFKHLLLATGYVIMLFLVVPMLWWFQTDKIYPIYNPQRWLGYYATIVLIFTSIEIIIGRIRKQEEIHKFSHPSDWLFPIFLLVGSVTGILVHIFRYVALPWPTYVAYTVHLMAMVAMLDTEVGIGKWTHLIYRPLAISLDLMKREVPEQVLGPVPSGTD
jgi:quinone-modifying oxidoreductase subunit QmoC